MRKLTLTGAMLLLGLCGAASATPTIRVLNLYTPEAVSYLGGVGAVTTVINNQIVRLNQAFASSGVDVVAESAGSASWTTSAVGIVAVVDQAFANYSVKKQRDDSEADVVMVLHYYSSTVKGYARNVPPFTGAVSSSFAGVIVDSLAENVYQHEFGHLLGARHQKADGIAGNDADPDSAHGFYQRWGAPYNGSTHICMRTIMAMPQRIMNDGNDCERSWPNSAVPWLMFSNPSKLYTNPATGETKVLGSATAGNVAAVLNSRGPTVANYSNIKLYPAFLRAISTIIGGILGD